MYHVSNTVSGLQYDISRHKLDTVTPSRLATSVLQDTRNRLSLIRTRGLNIDGLMNSYFDQT